MFKVGDKVVRVKGGSHGILEEGDFATISWINVPYREFTIKEDNGGARYNVNYFVLAKEYTVKKLLEKIDREG